jgi:hypothetical protein
MAARVGSFEDWPTGFTSCRTPIVATPPQYQISRGPGIPRSFLQHIEEKFNKLRNGEYVIQLPDERFSRYITH